MLPNLVPTTHQERSISEPAIRTTRANCRQVAVIRSCVTSEELFINYNCKQTNPHKCTAQSRRKHCTQKHSRRISKTRVGGGDFLERWNWKNSKDLRRGSGGRIISSFESLSSKMDLKFVTFLALFVSASAQFFGPSSCVGFNCGPPPLGPCFGVACPPPSVFLPPPAPAPCLFGVIGVACAPSPPPSVFIQAPPPPPCVGIACAPLPPQPCVGVACAPPPPVFVAPPPPTACIPCFGPPMPLMVGRCC